MITGKVSEIEELDVGLSCIRWGEPSARDASCYGASVDFTEASWSPTQTAEVDATDATWRDG
ncbi:MAG: hypothetical protein RIC12_00425 [Pirellulales bacterium]